MNVYYRATDMVEFKLIDNNAEVKGTRGVTYWTDGVEAARLYQAEGRVIVKITVENDIPAVYKGVAHQADAPNHNEWVVPHAEFEAWLGRNLVDVELV